MKIYNSLTRKKEDLVPIRPGEIGMYVCGPTVYDDPHIGHARSAYIFDVIRRYFAYSSLKVMFVRNVTDVDDKIIDKAKRLRDPASGARDLVSDTGAISKRYLDAYHEDMGSLGIGRPDREPKATEYIPKMVRFIEALIDKGCAYAAGGDVYFDIKKARGYGKLSNQDTAKMESGARVSPGEKKRDALDFALWKAAKEGEPAWQSPWGMGRPGWHIECSVMSSDILGPEFDIHGGGIDLIFPHHENEIAQSEGAGERFARCWIHNGLLTINGEKMAKSLGNFITIKDFLKAHRDPDYLKLLFLNTHYRHPVDYTEEKIAEMKAQKERFVILIEKLKRVDGRPEHFSRSGRFSETPDRSEPPARNEMPGHPSSLAMDSQLSAKPAQGAGEASPKGTVDGKEGELPVLAEARSKFEEAMDDDFNTPLALAALFDLVSHINKLMQGRDALTADEAALASGAAGMIVRLAAVFGLDLAKAVGKKEIDEREVLSLIAKRNECRKARDFKAADTIRKSLLEDFGIIIEDTKDGTVWRKCI